MPKFTATRSTGAAGLVLLMATACSPGAAGGAALPTGETNLSCAAIVFAANELVRDNSIADADGTIGNAALATITAYATAYAEAEGKSVDETLNAVKIQAYRMDGSISSGGRLPNDQIAERARKCINP